MSSKPRPSAIVKALKALPPDVVRLAKSLSLAAFIEPALIRLARIEAHPRINVSAESALWFSPIVDSRSLNGIALRHDVAAALREDLRQDARLAQADGRRNPLESARRLVRRAHLAAPTTIRLHEELIWLELTAAKPDIDQLLDEIFFRMLADPTEGPNFASWFSALKYELPDGVQASRSFQTLDGISSRLLRRKQRLARHEQSYDAPFSVSGRPLTSLPTTIAWAALTADALVIQSVKAEGFHPIELPKTNLLFVEVELEGSQFRRYFWDPREPFWFSFAGAEITIRTLAGVRIRFTRRREGQSSYDSQVVTRAHEVVGRLVELGRTSPKISIDLEILALNRSASRQRGQQSLLVDYKHPSMASWSDIRFAELKRS